jgi:hypothetical protein
MMHVKGTIEPGESAAEAADPFTPPLTLDAVMDING